MGRLSGQARQHGLPLAPSQGARASQPLACSGPFHFFLCHLFSVSSLK